MFWTVVSWLCWTVIRPRIENCGTIQRGTSTRHHASNSWLNPQSIFTSLVLFNILFAIENALDLVFLWSGAKLPHGLTYAEYAHQGVYPLMVTAVLAAGFVLMALKPGAPTQGMKTIRWLVYAWVGQNVFLDTSCALRMIRYIEAYSLTELRVTVLIWTALVAAGLILIVVRIFTARTNRWLVNANALALAATLYVLCFLNVPAMISQYNVEHCGEITGGGPALDASYLMSEAGVDAIPAIIWLQKHGGDGMTRITTDSLEVQLREDMQDWRTWSLRQYRLAEIVRKNDAARSH